ncbi:MAG TPA: acetylxylan esterase [Vicinamibacteria bacterium]|nr:acetylxylan esterase [Vicinamibacteria bacterium]
MRRMGVRVVGLALAAVSLGAQDRKAERPTAAMLSVLDAVPEPGPRITLLLRHQLDRAWAQDDARRARFAAVRTEADLHALQDDLRAKALALIGGLPGDKAPLHARVTGVVPRDGYDIEKLVFESLPGLHVTASVYVPDRPEGRRPAVLVACGHSPLGKGHPPYQEIAGRLARRGYVVLVWDPVGQGERSQFWDAARGRSRYNLVCGEHAVLGNLATLAGASLVRWMVWDGMRAVDYLLTRPDVDPARIAITGTSGGGFQSLWIGALDPRIGLLAPSCFVTALPMRMANRIFEDPDSDPEQDPPGLVAEGIDHAGLVLLAYPRPVHVAAAVKDFFPIEGTRKTVREVAALYRAFGHEDRFQLSEGYHTHQYSAENQAAAFAFLDRWAGLPPRKGLDPVTTVDPESLRSTASGQVRLDLPGRSLPELIRDFYRERRGQRVEDLDALYRAGGEPDRGAWPIVPYDGGPANRRTTWEKAGTSKAGRLAIDRYVLRHDGALVLPLLHVRDTARTPSGRVVLRVSLEGKAAALDWTAVEADLGRGDEVVSFDPRGLGETRLRYKAQSIDDEELARVDEDAAYVSPISGVLANYVYNALLTGRPYFLEVLEDAEIAVRFSRERLGARSVSVVGSGDGQLFAEAIAAVVPGVALRPPPPGGATFSWAGAVAEMRETWPIHYLVPGGAYVRLRGGKE